MDYKELIERLRKYDGLLPIAKEAATAIEALLAEREAAVEELSKRPHHSTRKYVEHCDYISVITEFPDCYSCDEW